MKRFRVLFEVDYVNGLPNSNIGVYVFTFARTSDEADTAARITLRTFFGYSLGFSAVHVFDPYPDGM
ncbi:MAG: hypothetical protein K0M46_08190 [Thiobacillus sp.]|nr:hypothetical protein [Thiobacillus sp.]